MYQEVRRRDPDGLITNQFLEWECTIHYQATELAYNPHYGEYECYICHDLFRHTLNHPDISKTCTTARTDPVPKNLPHSPDLSTTWKANLAVSCGSRPFRMACEDLSPRLDASDFIE
ncbi:hypothetical protein FCULG_00000374 [Fusarium culmorum]|uniref:Uncharacterized protein n=1 Tax=Fusarium culmorum TaxID=5516 RepID=A0A2T4GJS9_FUSCU|nr:hypothetical protein FCULG_00000374 [Fusarium culmorum]